VAVGVFALDRQLDAADAGLLAVLEVEDLDLEAAALAPALVHALQHLGPVLAVDPAGAGVDRDDRVGRVEAAAQHALKLHLGDADLEGLETGGSFENAGVVLGLTPELVERLGVVEALLGVLQVVDDLLGGRLLAQQLLGLVVLAPKRRVGGLGVELLESL
jgi:hypothetical protein